MVTRADSQVLLINISGHDKPGVTHSMTEILGRFEARILDVGQAVIHNSLALGMLVEMTESMRSSPLLTELLLAAHELGVQVRFTTVTSSEYREWVQSQGNRRFLITILGRSITAGQLADVSGILARAGLNIDRIDRLSGRTALDEASPNRVCFEMAISGELANEDKVRAPLMRLTEEHNIDIAFQYDNLYRRNRRLVAFDMDSTLIRTEIIDELARHAGVGEEVAKITESAMRGELDFKASFRRRLSLLKGLPEAVLDDVRRNLPLMDGADRLIGTLKKLGYKTAILSGGFTFVGRELQNRLGIDYLRANELGVINGVVTGEVVGEIVDGAKKAQLLEAIAATEGLSMQQVIAVGDGANDLPMLSIAGLGIAFRAKPVVRQSAHQAISTMGLDGILYLLGLRDRDSF